MLFGLIFLGIYLCFRFTYAWYMDPSSCRRCHEVVKYRLSWEESSHKDLDCRVCHKTRGPFHRLDSTLRGLRDVGIHIKGDYFSLKAVYYDSNCINCHRDTGHKHGLDVDERFEELEQEK